MPIVTKHPHGAFSWIELATTDQAGAKDFYTSLLGWTVEDTPMGPDMYYTMFLLGGRTAGAAYTMHGAELEHGAPPHWNVYINVDDADAAAAKAAELGGTVLAGPFDVMEHGRMAVLRDPTGAAFCIWQAKTHIGVSVQGEPGSLCWCDLNMLDQPAATAFYGGLFGWTFDPGMGDTGYLHIKNGDAFIGGIPSAQQLPPGITPHWAIYLQVANCDASTEKAKASGATVIVPPMTLENTGRMSVISDPQGAVLSLFEDARG